MNNFLYILLGLFILLLILGFAIGQFRFQFVRSIRWRADACPRCGSDLHRVHRTSLDRILSNTLLPGARRYGCSNRDCGWTGLRQRRPSDRKHHQVRSN